MRTTEKWISIQEKYADIVQKNGIHSMNVRKHRLSIESKIRRLMYRLLWEYE